MTVLACEQPVTCSPQRAFAVFTDGLLSWWPRHHHLSDADLQDIWIEPRPGGRWRELDADGRLFTWAHVTHWQPGVRLELSVGVNADYDYVPPPGPATTLALDFEASPDGCLVRLEHAGFEAHGEDGARRLVADLLEVDYWPDALRCFAAVAEGRAGAG